MTKLTREERALRRDPLSTAVVSLLSHVNEPALLVAMRPRPILIRRHPDSQAYWRKWLTCLAGLSKADLDDLGVGFDPAHAARIFDPFVTTKAGGLGMGLSIGSTIATAHGGRLWATQNAERGVTFHLSLPVASREPEDEHVAT